MGINATAVWRVRPSGNNANGGGFDPGIASPGTDRSQQNAAQVTFNGTTITATTAGVGATITFSGGTGYTATAADIANCLHITGGTNFIAGWYFITAQGGTTWTLDRNCTTGAGAAMTGNMGGGWADFWTNTTATAAILVPGNTVYILGSGIPNPSSYTYDYTMSASVTWAAGNRTAGFITVANDPLTPSYKAPPDTTGGMPCSNLNGFSNTANYTFFSGLWMVYSGAGPIAFYQFDGPEVCFGCVVDEFGFNVRPFFSDGNQDMAVIGCETFSSQGGTGGSSYAFAGNSGGHYRVIGCNFHDCVGGGIQLNASSSCVVEDTIISKCAGSNAILINGSENVIKNNTIDGNVGNGIEISTQAQLSTSIIFNNIISNHTGVGAFGLTIDAGTAAANNRLKLGVDYNAYYNNTSNYNAISASPHDTALVTTPYNASATEDYKLI